MQLWLFLHSQNVHKISSQPGCKLFCFLVSIYSLPRVQVIYSIYIHQLKQQLYSWLIHAHVQFGYMTVEGIAACLQNGLPVLPQLKYIYKENLSMMVGKSCWLQRDDTLNCTVCPQIKQLLSNKCCHSSSIPCSFEFTTIILTYCATDLQFILHLSFTHSLSSFRLLFKILNSFWKG